MRQLREILVDKDRAVTRADARMGGVGKTQLAIEYGYRFIDQYDRVLLIPAEQDELIGTQLAQLAILYGLAGDGVTTAAAVAALHAEVANSKSRWLLIFDNAENPKALQRWLPPRGGHIIITSRNPGWGEIASQVEVGLFGREDSIELLRQRVPGLSNSEAKLVAQQLGDFPLAVAQAAAVIAKHGLSAVEYVDLLAEAPTQVLDDEKPSSYPDSAAKVIGLSVERLADAYPDAAQLLSLCAFLAPEPIPVSWFIKAAPHLPEPLRSAARQRYAFSTNVVSAMAAYGLVGTSVQGVQVHRLTCAMVRSRLGAVDRLQLHGVAEAVVVAVAPADTDATETWPEWSAIAPHIITLDPGITKNDELRAVACRFVLYLLRRAENPLAVRLVEQWYLRWSKQFGADDIYTLKAATEYAHALHVRGDIDQAMTLMEDTLPRTRAVLGEDNPQTLRAASDLAVCMNSVGEHDRALALDEDVLTRRVAILGEDHPDTLKSMVNKAATLSFLNDFSGSLSLGRAALSKLQNTLGSDHPDTMQALGGVANSLHNLGDYRQALDIESDLLPHRIRILGEGHPDTLWSWYGMGYALLSLKRFLAAREAVQKCLAGRRKIYRSDHRELLQAYRLSDAVAAQIGGRSLASNAAKKEKKKKKRK